MLWPGLLGQSKYDFAKTYCAVKRVQTSEGKHFQDFSKGIRLEELNMLLRQTVMIRRLKKHVMEQLPPKRRKIIRLSLKRSDIVLAKTAVGTLTDDASKDSEAICKSSQLSYQELGIAKLSGFCEWLSIQPLISESDGAAELDVNTNSQKMIIFAHHHKVLDGVQELMCEKGVCFVRIDGNTLARDRQSAVLSFQSSNEVKIAIIGITAGGVGLDFSSAQNVVFLELPQSPSLMLQAEDRAHRRGQTNAVNIYIFCAKDTMDERHWQYLNKSLHRVSSTTNGKYDAVPGIVDGISYLETIGKSEQVLDAEYGNLSTTELRKLTDFGSAQAIQPLESHDEAAGMINDRSREQSSSVDSASVQADNFHLNVEKASGILDQETIGKSEQVLDAEYGNLSTTELRKLTDFGSAQAIQPLESHDEAAGMINDRSREQSSSVDSASVQADNFHLNVEKASGILDQELYNYFVANENPERNVSENEIGSHSGVSSSILDEGNGGKHQLEKEQKNYSRTTEIDNFRSIQEDGVPFSNQVYSLRFEVSKYTGRIHLYSCIPGTDSRPQPLFENFRPEELESLNSSVADDDKEITSRSLKVNPAYRHALLAFINEWNKLRPIERRKLVGKSLQLPLDIELSYLNENINHSTEGLLKGGSKRRMTPWHEISYPLPSNADWKKVNLSGSYGKKEKQYTQGWTLMDEPLCKLCQTPCKGINAKTPEFFEDLFCNLSCYEEYRVRTSSRSLRQELFQIEHGVCMNCKLDCHQLVKTIKPLSLERRREYIVKVAPNLASRKKFIDKLVNNPSEGNAWHADHIIPVYRGGGECRLENMRTLCVACHYDVTAAQRAERLVMRSKAKEQLKVIMRELKYNQNMVEIDSDSKGLGHSDVQEDETEDELLVKVPGSAYSAEQDADPEGEELNTSSKMED
ncbi:hypothetical protein MANES_06G087800v8 [Manihot esculenta]|uniref:Uncharacterized protein n=1 Tax=Manihot esculenta TaxID=3983 RepID=A0ACB7HIQ4_MANES|nr:hypothetical protein MANES_06G087800v8 [Manihot esculenta]